MPAAQIKTAIGDEIWESNLKFCNIRNPFDILVSVFWMKIGDTLRADMGARDFA